MTRIPAARLLAGAARRRAASTEIALGPLEAAETAELAASVAGRALTGGRRPGHPRGDRGQPVVRGRDGPRRPCRRRAGGAPATGQAAPAPRRRRSSRSSPPGSTSSPQPARDLASLAATVGRAFTSTSSRASGAATEDALVAGLEELLDRRLDPRAGRRGVRLRPRQDPRGRLRDDDRRAPAPAAPPRRRGPERAHAAGPRRGRRADRGALRAMAGQPIGRPRLLPARRGGRAAARREPGGDRAPRPRARAADGIAAGAERDDPRARAADGARRVARRDRAGTARREVGAVVRAVPRAVPAARPAAQPADPARARDRRRSPRPGSTSAMPSASSSWSIAERDDDPILRVEAHYVLAWRSCSAARSPRPRGPSSRRRWPSTTARARAAHIGLYSQDPAVVCLIRLGVGCGCMGDGGGSERRRAREPRRSPRELGHPFSLGYALTWDAVTRCLRGRRRGAPGRRRRRRSALGSEHRMPFWVSFATTVRGWAIAEQGEVDGGRRGDPSRGWPTFAAIGSRAFRAVPARAARGAARACGERGSRSRGRSAGNLPGRDDPRAVDRVDAAPRARRPAVARPRPARCRGRLRTGDRGRTTAGHPAAGDAGSGAPDGAAGRGRTAGQSVRAIHPLTRLRQSSDLRITSCDSPGG